MAIIFILPAQLNLKIKAMFYNRLRHVQTLRAVDCLIYFPPNTGQ